METSLLASQVERCVYDFFRYLDFGEYENLSGMVSPSGIWHRQGLELLGPEMVLEALRKRPVGVVTAHLIGNLTVAFPMVGKAVAKFYATTFRSDSPVKRDLPIPIDHPYSVTFQRQEYLLDNDRWLLTLSRGHSIFAR